MALYTRKNGIYVKLNKEQIRKLRRLDEVMALQESSRALVRCTMALVAWLGRIDKQGMRLSQQDLVVARLPNQDRLMDIAEAVVNDVEKLR